MEHLKTLRKEKGLTQSQLGDILHVSKASIGSYERGERTPAFETLKSLCNFFDVSLEYILDFSEQRSKNGADEEILKMYYSLSGEDRNTIFKVVQAFYLNTTK